MRCMNCYQEIPDSCKFCPNCGAKQPVQKMEPVSQVKEETTDNITEDTAEVQQPTEKVQIAAVQKKPELVRLFTNTTEKVQLSAVIASPESVLLMQAPSPLACFTAVEGMFTADLPPTADILAAARRLVFRMKGNRKLGEPDTEAVKEFFDEVKSFKH